MQTKQKLFLALPVYGGFDPFFTQCLIKLLQDPPGPMMLRMNPGDSLVSRSRNGLTADFLASDATDLLFVDTDLIFSGDHVRMILSHDVDVVGGFYPKKIQDGPVQWVCNACFEEQPVLESGLQRVRYMGTGFLRIRRRVFERMIERYPHLAFKPDHAERTEHDFWSVGVYHGPLTPEQEPQVRLPMLGRYLSEDWFFCQRWLDCGGQVWGDTRIVLKHVGQAIYPLKFQEVNFRPAEENNKILALPSQAAPGSEEADIAPGNSDPNFAVEPREDRTPCPM